MDKAVAKEILTQDHIEGDLLDLLVCNEKMAELGRVAAGVVHELNTPLSVIVSATQMILREDDLPEFVKTWWNG